MAGQRIPGPQGMDIAPLSHDQGIRQRIAPARAAGIGVAASAPAHRPIGAGCVATGKTLCHALFELAAYENQKGTMVFVKEIIDRKKLVRGELVISHNPVTGGGDPQDPGIENSEFKDPRLPYYVDTEYIEVGYALTKQGMDAKMGFIAWVTAKKAISLFTGDSTTGLSHRPNALGLQIGEMIAKRYRNIAHFAEEFCGGKCE
ncbi:hypothetical protein FNU76_14755 [Chitinimonas arctica]|uniref:Uncharacterized protein n=1 Tax=Chitinimonas arctica TaxID=2594795 RepID=A0A516SH76_9NEIS|nr:hypothetical protein [Chitinimonas arctica]QDQ27514.1 hypothetical protein FNU76_14755 [Chitinimonas arctica]